MSLPGPSSLLAWIHFVSEEGNAATSSYGTGILIHDPATATPAETEVSALKRVGQVSTSAKATGADTRIVESPRLIIVVLRPLGLSNFRLLSLLNLSRLKLVFGVLLRIDIAVVANVSIQLAVVFFWLEASHG